MPLVNSSTCESQLRATRLSSTFNLDENSFICAGGEASKGEKMSWTNRMNILDGSGVFSDACLGDGGSGLVCSVVRFLNLFIFCYFIGFYFRMEDSTLLDWSHGVKKLTRGYF
jgi:hypothetical protein